VTAPPQVAPAGATPMLSRTLMWVLWPGFLLACVIELLVFGLVDPGDLRWAGETLPLSRQSVYAAAFFVFWGLATLASALTVLLALPPAEFDDAELQRPAED
jgi:hypothetical protein